MTEAHPSDSRAERLMREFYLSSAYDPKAARPADTVRAAIEFALSAAPGGEGEPVALDKRPFPIMGDDAIQSVPWWLPASVERRLMLNHGRQTVARLAERGGLDVCELAAALEGKSWGDIRDPVAAKAIIDARLRAAEVQPIITSSPPKPVAWRPDRESVARAMLDLFASLAGPPSWGDTLRAADAILALTAPPAKGGA